VKIHDVFSSSAGDGTYYTRTDGTCGFDVCRANTELRTCASLGCDDASQLDDPACVQTGARCACHGQDCAAP
jgi:hypothetical protein